MKWSAVLVGVGLLALERLSRARQNVWFDEGIDVEAVREDHEDFIDSLEQFEGHVRDAMLASQQRGDADPEWGDLDSFRVEVDRLDEETIEVTGYIDRRGGDSRMRVFSFEAADALYQARLPSALGRDDYDNVWRIEASRIDSHQPHKDGKRHWHPLRGEGVAEEAYHVLAEWAGLQGAVALVPGAQAGSSTSDGALDLWDRLAASRIGHKEVIYALETDPNRWR